MSKDGFTAEDIFTSFQTRREVLARTGTLAAAGALPAVLAACAVEPNPTVTGPDGKTLIQVIDGQNCFDGGCMRLDLVRREVSMLGREPAEVPDDIALESGTVTPEEFARLRRLARTAPRKQPDGGGAADTGADGGAGSSGGSQSDGGGPDGSANGDGSGGGDSGADGGAGSSGGGQSDGGGPDGSANGDGNGNGGGDSGADGGAGSSGGGQSDGGGPDGNANGDGSGGI